MEDWAREWTFQTLPIFFLLRDDTTMRLLLVEDDSRIARFVARGLREQAYAVDVVANGDDALYQVEINDYDLVILDVMLPGKDGFATCRAIRNLGKHMPILMLTARDAVDDRITGLDSGADDYLTKPFEFGELLARLRALLRRSKELRPSRIVVGDLELRYGSTDSQARQPPDYADCQGVCLGRIPGSQCESGGGTLGNCRTCLGRIL